MFYYKNLNCRTNLTLQIKLNPGGISLFYKDLVCSTHLQVLWHTHSLKLHTDSLQMHAKNMQNKLKVRFNLFYIKNSLINNLENNVEQTEPMQKNVLFHLRVQIQEINIKLLIFENWRQNKLNHRQENVLFNRPNLTREGECSIGEKIESRQQNKVSFCKDCSIQ